MKKTIIIDGDKFQKEYKDQYRKEVITNLIQGIIFLIISCAGLFFGSKILLKLAVFILPLFILTYAINLFSMGITSSKSNKSQAISFYIQALILALFAVYIFLNPIDTLGFILIAIGIMIIINAIIKMVYFPNYFPIGSLIAGAFLILFSDLLIDLFYTIVMLFLFIYGISKVCKALYDIKNK